MDNNTLLKALRIDIQDLIEKQNVSDADEGRM